MSEAKRDSAVRLGRLAIATDVARLAGVSQSAVSRTFTDGASVSPATREKVLEAARTLKYRPNQIARSLITQRGHVVAVVVTHIDNLFYPLVLETLSEELRLAGYRILLFVTHGSVDFDPVLDELLRRRVDALILASTSLSSALAEECREVGMPVVMFNNTDPKSTVMSVGGENFLGAKTNAAFLHAAGHRRFGFIAGVDDSSTTQQREAGFASYLAEQGLPKHVRALGYYQFDRTMDATRALLKRKNPPDAIFCTNDHMALAALQVAQYEFGLEPGRQISIVGFDDATISAWPSFRLTTYSQPVGEMVKRAIEMICAALEGEPVARPQETIPGNLIVRSSARLPPTGFYHLPNGLLSWRPPDAKKARAKN